MVTPEIAAKIVKLYVLPMFNKPGNQKSRGIVFDQLNLTDKLDNKLDVQKKANDDLQFKLERVKQENKTLYKQVRDLKREAQFAKQQVQQMKHVVYKYRADFKAL